MICRPVSRYCLRHVCDSPIRARCTQVTALSDLLTSANTAGLGARAISRAARGHGFTLNPDTAARYLRGDHGRPDERTLEALAVVLELPLAELRRAADVPEGDEEPYTPPKEASRLNRRQRRAVDEVIRAMLVPRAASTAGQTEDDQGEIPALRRAARRGSMEPPTE